MNRSFKILKYALYLLRVTIFRLLNSGRFKRLGKRSLICKPLRLNGRKYMSIGDNTSIQKFTWLFALKTGGTEPVLSIGDRCAIGDFNHIAAVRKVIIGNDVLTANRVYISDNIHEYEDITRPVIAQPVKFKGEVIIGDGSWLGENVCIIGAKIGKHCVIGANSVVTKDIPDFSVAAGVPAKVIKKYNPETKKWERYAKLDKQTD